MRNTTSIKISYVDPINFCHFRLMNVAIWASQWKNSWCPKPFDWIDRLCMASTMSIALRTTSINGFSTHFSFELLNFTMVKQSVGSFPFHRMNISHTQNQRKHHPKYLPASFYFSNSWCERTIYKCYNLNNRHCLSLRYSSYIPSLYPFFSKE